MDEESSTLRVPRLHILTDDAVLARPDLIATGRALLDLGVALHLRGWITPVRRRFELAQELLSGEARGVIQINDRLDLALALRLPDPLGSANGARVGVHLPERAFPAAEARALLGPGPLLGRSVHAPHTEAHLDYLVTGTLFATPSHPDRAGAGWALLDRSLESVRGSLPILGIGGMTPSRAADLAARGGWGVAVLRGVWEASDGADPMTAAQHFLDVL